MSYAIKRADNWRELGGGFEADGVHYPVGWLASATPEDRAAIGIFPVAEADDPPSDQRVIGSSVIDDGNGRPVRVHILEPLSAEDIRRQARADVERRVGQAFLAGFAPPHPSFLGQRLQVRDNEDRTNWLTSQASYAAAVSAGYGDVIDASFRTTSNATITVSYADGLNILLAMAAWGRDIFARSWALKDAIDAGEPYDIDTGWPE